MNSLTQWRERHGLPQGILMFGGVAYLGAMGAGFGMAGIIVAGVGCMLAAGSVAAAVGYLSW